MAKSSEKKQAKGGEKIARPMGHFERYEEALFLNEQYCGTGLTCRYALPEELVDMTKHAEVQSQFIRAIAQTILDHPLLQVGHGRITTKKPVFTKLDTIDLDEIVDWRVVSASENYAAEADKRLSEETDKKFTHLDTRPGWRMVIMRPENAAYIDAMWIWRHSIADGMSAKIFHQTVLEHVNDPEANADRLNLDGNVLKLPAEGVNYPPPMDKLCDFTLTPGYTVSSAWRELKPSMFRGPNTATQKEWGTFKRGAGKTVRRAIRVNNETTKKFVEACRAHNTTVTAALHGIAMVSLLWEKVASTDKLSYAVSTAIDLRRFVGNKKTGLAGAQLDPHKTIANIVTALQHGFDEEYIEKLRSQLKSLDKEKDLDQIEKLIWPVAHTAREHIKERLDLGLKNEIVSMMKFVPDWPNEGSRNFKKPRLEAYQITNLGAMDGAPPSGKGGWRITRGTFNLSAETTRPLFFYSATSVKGGDMVVDFGWQDGLNEYVVNLGERIWRDTSGWINYIATSEWKVDDTLSAFD